MQAHVFMAKGDIPIAKIFFTISRFKSYIPLLKCIISFFLLNILHCQVSEIICDNTVARAAPLMPMSNGQMKIGERMVLITTLIIVAYMA